MAKKIKLRMLNGFSYKTKEGSKTEIELDEAEAQKLIKSGVAEKISVIESPKEEKEEK